MKLFDQTLSTLERSLDARLLRHNVLSGNLANVDTPGFVPKDVDFAAAMAKTGSSGELAVPRVSSAPENAPVIALDTPRGVPEKPALAAPGSPVVAVQGAAAGLDGNSVDLDRTLASIAENGLQYGATARAAAKKLAILRYVASDGVG